MCRWSAYNAGEIFTILEGRLILIFLILVNSRPRIVIVKCAIDILINEFF